MAALQLHVDLFPGIHHLILERNQSVVGAYYPQNDSRKDDQQDDRAHVRSFI